MDSTRKASAAPARRVGNGGNGPEVEAGKGKGKGKLSQVWGVRKKSITPAQFHESLRKQAAEQVGKQALKRRQGIVDKAKELWRRDSPKKKEVVREPLPATFLLLEKYFECLEAASSLLRTRRKMCTFSAVAKTVENMTGRRFTTKHLAQIKYIFPEVLGLELVSYKDADTSKIIRDLKVTLLQISPDSAAAGDGNQGKERYRTMEVSRKEEFRAKLLAHLKAHPEFEEIPEAVVPQHHSVAEPPTELLAAQRNPSSPKSFSRDLGHSETTSHHGEPSETGDSRALEDLPIQEGHGFEVAGDWPRKLKFSLVADEEEIASARAARAEELEGTRMSHFGALFKPFFSARPDKVTSRVVIAGEKQGTTGEVEDVADAHMSHFAEAFRPSFSVKQGESGFRVPRDVPRKLNFSFAVGEKQAATAEDEELEDTRMSHFAASFRPSFSVTPSKPGFKVPRDVPRKLNFSCAAGEKQTPAAEAEGLGRAMSPVEASTQASLPVEPINSKLSFSSPFKSVEALELPVHSNQSAVQPSDLTPDTSHESVPESPSSCQFSQTPETSSEKNPFLRVGKMRSYSSAFSLRPCDAAKSQDAADVSSSPCQSVPYDASPIPGTPYQPSPFVGYSQHFVAKNSASTPLDVSASQAQGKPSFSTPVRPQTAARELRFGTPVPAQIGVKFGSTDLSAAEHASLPEKNTSSGSVIPHVSEQRESSDYVSICPMSPCSASIQPVESSLATPSCSTPQRFQEARARGQSEVSAAKELVPQEHHTPKRSRVNLGLVFDQDPEGQESGTPFSSPSKKLHAAVVEQEQVEMQHKAGRKLSISGQGMDSKSVSHRLPSAPKAAASSDPEIVKCLPTRLVQSVREKERRALDEKSRGVAEMRKLAQMKADLPKLLSTLRQIFQDRSVLPHQDLISKVVYSNMGLKDTIEVEERLQLLLDLAPDWISLKTSSTGDRLYRISKTVNVVSVRKRIAGSA